MHLSWIAGVLAPGVEILVPFFAPERQMQQRPLAFRGRIEHSHILFLGLVVFG